MQNWSGERGPGHSVGDGLRNICEREEQDTHSYVLPLIISTLA